MDATQPQNDRELLLKLNGNVETLANSINRFGETLKELEENRIGSLDLRMKNLEDKWTQVTGGWKLIGVIWAILTAAGVVGLVKTFFK